MLINYGFVILRNVRDVKTNHYWIECYNCIRRFYPDTPIVIIDDNSNSLFVSKNKILTNTTIIKAKKRYKGRGELLPYLYYLRKHWFETAIILHDSVFIQKYVDFSKYINVQLWHFDANIASLKTEECALIRRCLNYKYLLKQYKKRKWLGCFGGMSVISYEFVKEIEEKYKLFTRLITCIKCRKDRMCFERIIGLLLYLKNKENKENKENKIYIKKDCTNFVDSIFGDIITYCDWGYNYNQYICDKNNHKIDNLIVKCWTGR